MRIDGPLDLARLEGALSALVQRHEILRTGFSCLPARTQADQWIAEHATPSLEQRFGMSRLDEFAASPPDLAAPPLLRACLLQAEAVRRDLLLVLPSLCGDRLSLGFLVADLAALYAGQVLPPPLQFADAAEWQSQRRDPAPDGMRHVPLRLPTERRIDGTVPFTPRRVLVPLDPPAAGRLARAARACGTSEAAVLLACWVILWARMTDETEVPLALACDGRGHPDLRGAVGPYARYVPVGCGVAAGASFAQVAASAAEWLREAESHQDSFPDDSCEDEKVDMLPLAFDAHDVPMTSGSFRILDIDDCPDRCKIRLVAAPGRLELCYDSSRFAADFIGSLADSYRALLRSATEDLESPTHALDMTGDAQRSRILGELSGSRVEPEHGACVHHQIEALAAAHPDRTAVVSGEASLTYAELNGRANRIAHRLRAMGVGPESIVAVCLERSADLAAAVLGVLKAGGAYLPLDPTYPTHRLGFMLHDTKPAVLVSRAALAAALPAHGASALLLDADRAVIDDAPDHDPVGSTQPWNLAYVIYTSGSTGQPKGVLIEHGNLSQYTSAMRALTELSVDDRWLHTASFSFSSSVRQLLVPLTAGASVAVASAEEVRDARALFDLIRRQGVSIIDLVPSHLRACLASQPPGPAAELQGVPPADAEALLDNRLRLVLSASEPLPLELAAAWSDRRPARLVNMFGQTETTGIVTAHAGAPDSATGPFVPLGRPIPGVRIYVLDAGMGCVPLGAVGEIYVGGSTVGRGYLNRPELSEARFVEDPFEPGGRLYRTGDRGRWLPDGSLEFVGRLDDQVKIHGHRVEPGEVEANLRQHPGVAEAVVVPRPEEDGETRLGAYVVARPEWRRSVDPTRHRLPNGFCVAHMNAHETDFFYRQIFEDQTNFRHGVTLRDGDCVFDVGANIGLFTVFAQAVRRDVTVYAFEPIPETFAALQANAQMRGGRTHLFDCGLAEAGGEAEFEFYPDSTSQSGRYADPDEERKVLARILANQQRMDGRAGLDEAERSLLVEQRTRHRTVRCRLRTLSEVIREHAVERIDLLKIDVERSELDVLAGLEESDWDRVAQVVIEAHAHDGALERLVALLEGHGFHVVVEEDAYIRGSGLFNVYAVREPRPTERFAVPSVPHGVLEPADLRRFLQERLPEYAVPSYFVLLEALPRTPNGKVDRGALPPPGPARLQEREAVPPSTEEERLLASIWRDVLHLEDVGVHDNFLELGGDSIRAIQVVARAAAAGLEMTPLQLHRHPTIAELALVARHRASSPTPPEAKAAPDQDFFDLSSTQQGMLFHALYEPGSEAYIEQNAFTIHGEVDADALERAWQHVVARHPALRTSFTWEDADRPRQHVHRRVKVRMERHDFRDARPEEREKRLDAFSQAERERGFDLSSPPLMRLALIQWDTHEHVFLWSVHHLLLDGWSQGLVLSELSEAYQACREDEALALEPVPPYRSFIDWVAAQDRAAAEAFWRERLEGFTVPVALGVDRAPGSLPATGETWGECSMELSEAATDALAACARRHRLTPSTLVQAAWSVLLARYSGQDDILYGATVSGRPPALPRVESMVGLFINTLPVRVRLQPDETVVDLLRRMHDAMNEAREFEHSSLVDVLGWSGVRRDVPLFETLLIYQNLPQDAFGLKLGDRVEVCAWHRARTSFPLTAVAVPGRTLKLCLVYHASRFEASIVEQMLSHFACLLDAMASDPTRPVGSLPLDAARVDAGTAHGTGGGLAHERVAAQAGRSPQATAVVFEGGTLTYAELNARSNRLAHHLRAVGAGADRLVGIFLDRGPDLIVAVLAALKAGAAYLPLDPEWPAPRLAFMLDDAHVPLLVTRSDLAARLPRHAARIVCVDAQAGEIAACPADNPTVAVRPHDLAYVIYTSGSSGEPKGVMIEHEALACFVQSARQAYDVRPSDRVLQFASPCFDASVEEIFVTLASGASLALRTESMLSTADEFLRECERLGVTVLDLPTAWFHDLVAEAESSGMRVPGCLRLVIIGGEEVRAERIPAWNRWVRGRVRLVNSYGPTEATVVALLCDLPPYLETGPMPIGTALPGVTSHVLDNWMQPVPPGVPGELYLGGRSLARGYLNQPALTDARFVPNPFGEGRLYRTGDRVRTGDGGQLVYLGRTDRQVKIRGFRVEPGEVEAVLCTHPDVREAAVVVHEDALGQKRLGAYVTPASSGADPGTVRAWLQERLPAFMLPAVTVLEGLPRTPAGKVDRVALAARKPQQPVESGAVAPRTPLEESLTEIWREVLEVDTVGVHDNFFELGGHSLLATRIMGRLHKALGVRLMLRVLFERPTVAGLAEAIREAQVRAAAELQPVVQQDASLEALLAEVEAMSEAEAERGGVEAAGA